MSEKQCCEWHDGLPNWWQDPDGEIPEDNRQFGEGNECGLAGMGTPSACCEECPDIQHLKQRGLTIDYAVEIMALPLEERP